MTPVGEVKLTVNLLNHKYALSGKTARKFEYEIDGDCFSCNAECSEVLMVGYTIRRFKR